MIYKIDKPEFLEGLDDLPCCCFADLRIAFLKRREIEDGQPQLGQRC